VAALDSPLSPMLGVGPESDRFGALWISQDCVGPSLGGVRRCVRGAGLTARSTHGSGTVGGNGHFRLNEVTWRRVFGCGRRWTQALDGPIPRVCGSDGH
jgi:hypothetical protein